ncbi:MAG TPA: T9SS type A sorting domain-containing protein [Puia sp.]|nr:T9SS type A sorting domain-containing protein [Puia sp.]
MKKFYIIAIAVCGALCLQSAALFAQIPASTYSVTVTKTWTQEFTEPVNNACNGCTIDITGAAVFTVNESVTLTNSVINVENNTQLNIGAGVTLTLINSQIIVGDKNSTTSTANVFVSSGASISLDATSVFRLGNVNNFLSGGTARPAGQITAPVTISILGFTFTRNVAFYTATGSANSSPYNLNCNGSFPNTCKTGFVYGPVINAPTNLGGFITFQTLSTDAPLPVVLGSFNASLTTDNDVLLTWSTDQEINSSYFAVQRSSNGTDWSTIGKVGAKGNSATISYYSFTDDNAANGIDYYRLQMVNLDGSFAYSYVSVVRTTTVQNISVFPNPAKDYINITLGGRVPTTGVRLIDLSGKVLQEQRLNASSQNTTITMAVSNLPQGIYLLQALKADGTKYTTKVTIGIQQ